MFNIGDRTGKIELNRGDSMEAPIFINCGTNIHWKRYTLKENDTLYFAIESPNQPFENAIIKKVLTNKNLNKYGDAVIKLSPEDTVCLLPGKYYYEIKLRRRSAQSEKVDTVVNKTEFYIME